MKLWTIKVDDDQYSSVLVSLLSGGEVLASPDLNVAALYEDYEAAVLDCKSWNNDGYDAKVYEIELNVLGPVNEENKDESSVDS